MSSGGHGSPEKKLNMPSELNIASQYTPHVSRAPSRPYCGDQPRLGLWVRLRTFIKLAGLDEALAGGVDPGESRELTLRAKQLTKRRKRIGFARAIEKIVNDVKSPEPQILLRVFRRGPVRENRSLLLELAERLRAEAPMSLRGLAMVDLLLYYSDSPFYGARSALELERTVVTVLLALEPESR